MMGKVKDKHQVTIINKFAPTENLEDNGDINSAWHTVRDNINILAKDSLGYGETKHHKPQFGEEYSNWLIEGSRLIYKGCRIQVK
jgi:hypothetical protein